jgi:uncharacterized protein YutE (UPF0331/DUF86 family)
MVISSLNIGRILELLRYLESCVQELKPFSTMTREEFSSDRRNPPFVESYLRRSLEVVFDIGRHILSKTYGFREIEYRVIAKELGKRQVVTLELSDELSKMAGYRNRMVHFYKEVSPEELYGIVANDLKDFDRFAREVVAFIKAYEDKSPK